MTGRFLFVFNWPYQGGRLKKRFWIYLAGFVGVCFLILAVGGLYVLTLQDSRTAKKQEKKALFRQSAFYLKELNENLLEFRIK